MATEENSSPLRLPHYSELIISAIEAADNKDGLNKTTISKHIRSIYGQVPGHSALLSHNLNRMKKSGQLIMLNHNYLKPDPNAPRHKRGRPPKVKPSSSPNTAAATMPATESRLATLRPRRQPPRMVNPTLTPLANIKSLGASGRKYGRLRKAQKSSDELSKVATTEVANAPSRGRGRPPKVKPAPNALVGA